MKNSALVIRVWRAGGGSVDVWSVHFAGIIAYALISVAAQAQWNVGTRPSKPELEAQIAQLRVELRVPLRWRKRVSVLYRHSSAFPLLPPSGGYPAPSRSSQTAPTARKWL